jgi:predicted nucleic-acid-binding protein
MIGLDTNVLARYVVRDDARQTAAATRLMESSCTPDSPGVVPLVVLCELVWVLDRGYRYSRSDIATVLRAILSAADLHVERSPLAWQALNGYEDGRADFADYVIALTAAGESAETTYTFDRTAAAYRLFRLLA